MRASEQLHDLRQVHPKVHFGWDAAALFFKDTGSHQDLSSCLGFSPGERRFVGDIDLGFPEPAVRVAAAWLPVEELGEQHARRH